MYYIQIETDELCPTCGAPLESLVNSETADLEGERCSQDHDHLDNLFCGGAVWPVKSEPIPCQHYGDCVIASEYNCDKCNPSGWWVS